MEDKDTQSMRSKREDWLSRFDIHETNSIAKQLSLLTLNVTGFLILQETLKLAPTNKEGEKKVNNLLFTVFNRACLDSYMVSIRRISDDSGGVVSLVKLLKELKDHAPKMTRERLLAIDDLPYDWTELEKHEHSLLTEEFQNTDSNVVDVPTGHIGSSEHCRERHRQIDLLCGVKESERTPTDHVPKRLFNELNTRVNDACSKVTTHVNSYIAHASPKEKITSVEPLLMSDLHKAHQVLCEVAGFISLIVLGATEYRFYVHPQGYAFMYLDRPLCPESDFHVLDKRLEELEKQFSSYSTWTPQSD